VDRVERIGTEAEWNAAQVWADQGYHEISIRLDATKKMLKAVDEQRKADQALGLDGPLASW
jgi:hypothetical protein